MATGNRHAGPRHALSRDFRILTTDYRGEKNTEPLDMSTLAEELLQARDCLVVALQHLDDLRFGGYDRVLRGPWEVIGVFPRR